MKGFYYLLCLFFIYPDLPFSDHSISVSKIFDVSRKAITPKVSFIFPSCSSASLDDCLELLQATSQEWIAGVRGGGHGIKYDVRVRIATDKKLKFDSIWVSGKKLAIKIAEQLKDPETSLRKNDEINLVA